MQVIVANEPRSYREVIAETVQALRPQLTVTISEPDELEQHVLRLKPELVLCSSLTAAAHAIPLAWVLLYPNGSSHSVFSVAGHRTVVRAPVFADLLAVIDQVLDVAQLS